MTTNRGTHLHPLEMRKAFVSTCRHMFPNDRPLLARIKEREFTPAFPALTFANKGVLEEGMGRFLFQAMDAEAEGEDAARKAIRAHSRMGAVDVAASLVAILLNTRSEVPFFAAIVASERIMGDRSPAMAEMLGSMRASVEFFKACGESGAEYSEVVVGSELAARGFVAGTAALLGRGSGYGYEGLSLFRGVLAISGLVLEDENTLDGPVRSRLIEEYTLACRLLFSECQGALPAFSRYFTIAVKGGDLTDGREGLAFMRLFTEGAALKQMRDAKDDPRVLQLVIDGIVGLDGRVEEEPAILLS